MDNQQQAAALNQLSRLLFDKAAERWQWAIGLGLISGLVGLLVALFNPVIQLTVIFAGVTMLILLVSYYLRFSFEKTYDIAETMRRQSVLSEGLDWQIARAQFNDWRQLAGKRVLSVAAAKPRPDDYYETRLSASPKRLAEMTFESLFWTKSLYRKMQGYLGIVLVIAIVLIGGILLLSPLLDLDQSNRILLIYFVYLFVPVLISADVIGLLIRLRRLISALSAIEPFIEQLAKQESPELGEVMRLVAEYNCTVATGLPIPKWVFDRHYKEIQVCWS